MGAFRHHCECGGRKDDPSMTARHTCLDLDHNGSVKPDVRDRYLHESLMKQVITGCH